MKSLSVFFPAILLIQATTGRPADDDSGEYDEHQEHSYVFTSSSSPGQQNNAQFIKGQLSPPMIFRFDQPGQKSFENMFGLGGLGSFGGFSGFPKFPSFGPMTGGDFGGAGSKPFQIQHPGNFGKISGFTAPGSAGSAQTGSGTPGSSNSQVIKIPNGYMITQTSSSGPGNSQVSVSSHTSSFQDVDTSDSDEQEPSIVVHF